MTKDGTTVESGTAKKTRLLGSIGGLCQFEKHRLSKADIAEIQSDLAIWNKNEEQNEIIYWETDDFLLTPRDYGVRKFGFASFLDCMKEGSPIDVEFKGRLDPKRHQDRLVTEALRQLKPGRGGCIHAGCGIGKCLGKGTSVIMADGSVIPVESIRPNDRLMGPDGRPRRVLTTNKGRGPLYRIEPIKGEPWVCNDVHVMTLVRMGSSNDVIDIGLDEWLKRSKKFRSSYKQFSVGVDHFIGGIESPTIDPYFLGVWFGDGTKTKGRVGGAQQITHVAVSKPDEQIREICEDVAAEWGLDVRIDGKADDPTYHLAHANHASSNALLTALRKLIGPDVTIPDVILRGSAETRRQFLAGFLDADGELGGNCFIITQKRDDWARAVWWIARSLGLCATMTTRTAWDQNGTEGVYTVVTISGHVDQIPTRIPRRQAQPRRQRKVATRTGFDVVPIGAGDYYGFTLDGDGRFLLGDFTVTHNTVIALYIIAQLKRTAIVLVHSEFLADQWVERAKEFLGLKDEEIGRVQRDTCDFKGKKLVLGVVESMALSVRGKREDYPEEFYEWAGICIMDELHRYSSKTWHLACARFPAAFRLGLTATPKRTDGMEPIIFAHTGPVITSAIGTMIDPKIHMVIREQVVPKGGYCVFRGGRLTNDVNMAKLINTLAEDDVRNAELAEFITDALVAGRQIMILSDRLKQLQTLETMTRANLKEKVAAGETADKGWKLAQFVGGLKKEVRDEAAKADCRFSTWAFASEGVDVPALDCLIQATPRTNVEQGVGRILREWRGKARPFVVDIVDSPEVCQALANKRLNFYEQQGWPIKVV